MIRPPTEAALLRARMAHHDSQLARGETASVSGGLSAAINKCCWWVSCGIEARPLGTLDWQLPPSEKFGYTGAGIGSHSNAGTNKFLKSQSRGLDRCTDYGRLGRAEPQNL